MAGALLARAMLLLAVPGCAQALEILVLDERTSTPLANAEISILGLSGVATTDREGRLTWKPDPVPPFEVLVILPGGRFMRPVLVEQLTAGEPLVLRIAPLLQESVTVTAGAAPEIETTPASGTALLTARDLQARAPANLAQALENVAGVATVSEGHAAVPTVRGLARGRTLILIDGARVSSERRVGPSATFLDPFSLEDVEVARGPGSVAYGSDALGGVIYARTRRAAPGSPLGFRFAGEVGAGVPLARAAAEITKGLERGAVLLQARYRAARDYRSPRGTIFNSGWRDSGILARGEHTVGTGLLSVIWQSDFARDIERPRDNSRTVRFFYPEENSHRLTMNYELREIGGFSQMQFSGFLGSSTVITDQDRFATATAPRSVERADVRARDFQARASADRIVGPARVEGGLDVSGRFKLEALDIARRYDPQGGLASEQVNVSIADAFRRDTGVYLMTDVPIVRKLVASAGLRGDFVDTRNEGGYFGDRSTADDAFSGSASLTAGPFAGVRLTGQVARGFRDPVLSDRYYRGPSGRGFITGNPDLQPERSLQFDFAGRYTASRSRVAFYAFHYRIDDLVERYQTTPDNFFFRNRGRGQLRGVELEVQIEIGRGWTVDLAGHVIRGRALDDEAPLDDVPADTLSMQVRKQIAARGFAQVRGAVLARDTRPGPTERITPGYGIVDLSGGWRLTDQFELNGIIRNLFDKEYLASADPRAVPAPGIEAAVTLLVGF